jgi:hypothetical protein
MGPILLQRRRHPRQLPSVRRHRERRAAEGMSRSREAEAGAYGVLTLSDLIAGAWEQLGVRDSIRCPVCDGRMASCVEVPGDSLNGDCVDCGTRLS